MMMSEREKVRPRGCPLIITMSFQPAIPQRVARQQSPPPRHRPGSILTERVACQAEATAQDERIGGPEEGLAIRRREKGGHFRPHITVNGPKGQAVTSGVRFRIYPQILRRRQKIFAPSNEHEQSTPKFLPKKQEFVPLVYRGTEKNSEVWQPNGIFI